MSYRLTSPQTLTPITLAAASAVLQIDDPAGTPVYVDDTEDFNDVGAGDVAVWPASEAAGDQLAIGYTRPFRRLRLTIATAGVGGTMAVKYWNGTAWTVVTGLVDGTTGLTEGTSTYEITFDMPDDWEALAIDDSDELYFLVLEVATAYDPNPVLTQGWIVRGTPIAIPSARSRGSYGLVRLYARNTDSSDPAYLVVAGQDAAGARQIAASGLLPYPLEMDHGFAAAAPPELYSEATAPDPVVIDIDVAGAA